jgi:hypothetical protein
VALGSSDGRVQVHDFARFESTMLPYYYNPPAAKPQDIYRQETLVDGLSGVRFVLFCYSSHCIVLTTVAQRSYSVLSRDEAASSPMVPFDPPILTINACVVLT